MPNICQIDSGTKRTVMEMVNINLKWHHLNRDYRHYRTELAGTIRTVISNMAIINVAQQKVHRRLSR